jgi:hypothetical protein
VVWRRLNEVRGDRPACVLFHRIGSRFVDDLDYVPGGMGRLRLRGVVWLGGARATFDPFLLHRPMDSTTPSVPQEKVHGDEDGQKGYNACNGSNDPYHSLPSALSVVRPAIGKLDSAHLDNPVSLGFGGAPAGGIGKQLLLLVASPVTVNRLVDWRRSDPSLNSRITG